MLQDNDEIEITSGGQRWLARWHPANDAPDGHPHGSAGICVPGGAEVVFVSKDGLSWDFPAGRPERNESWEDTLRREMREEACVLVQEPKLLGFSRGRCIKGPEQGLVLVRAIWRTNVRLLPWKADFEMIARKTVPFHQAISLTPSAYHAVWKRAFAAAGLPLE